MSDGTLITEPRLGIRYFYTRRNPILADIFGCMGYMERQGSGLSKIRDAYEKSANFRKGMERSFYLGETQFTVTLPNLSYSILPDDVSIEDEKVAIEDANIAIDDRKVAIETKKVAIDNLAIRPSTKEKMRFILSRFGEAPFGRKDIAESVKVSYTAAGNIINKMKTVGLIEPLQGRGMGKYRFIK